MICKAIVVFTSKHVQSKPLSHTTYILLFPVTQEENLGGWRITRVIDGNDKADFTLPNAFSLKPGSKAKVGFMWHS